MTRRSAAARQEPEPSPTDRIREVIAAGVQLDTEAAMEIWVNINKARFNFQNEGKLLFDLLGLAPVNFDHTELRHRGCDPRNLTDVILQYVAKEGLNFGYVCKNMPSAAFQKRTEYKIPVEILRPLLANEPDDEVFFDILKKGPDLYSPEFDERLLKTLLVVPKNSHYGHNDVRDFILTCAPFWESRREDILPCLFDSSRIDSTDNFLSSFSKILRDAEKERIISMALETLTGGPHSRNKHDMNGKEFLQRLYTIAKKHLSEEGRLKVVAILRTKIDEFVAIQESRDPVEAFLEGEIPWAEVAFAKAQPAEYQKWLGTRHKEEEARRMAFREFGSFGMMMFEGGPYGRRWPGNG